MTSAACCIYSTLCGIAPGLCAYIDAEFDFTELSYLSDPAFETQWFLLKPKRPPRGINLIVLGTVYHPPQNNDLAMRNRSFQSLDIPATNFTL